VELRVQPGCSGDLVESFGRPGGRPVDEGDRQTVAGDDVPRSGVAVADDGVGCVTVEGPAVPDRVGWGLEVGGGVMKIVQ